MFELCFLKCLELLREWVSITRSSEKYIAYSFLCLESGLKVFHLFHPTVSEFSKFSVFLGDLSTITNDSMLAHLIGGRRRN